MSRSCEFFSFLEYDKAFRYLNKLRSDNADIDTIIKANDDSLKIVYQIKKKYGLSYNQFKQWVNANKEFLRIITKQERLALNQAKSESELVELLRSMDYTEIIENYLEDFDETFLEN